MLNCDWISTNGKFQNHLEFIMSITCMIVAATMQMICLFSFLFLQKLVGVACNSKNVHFLWQSFAGKIKTFLTNMSESPFMLNFLQDWRIMKCVHVGRTKCKIHKGLDMEKQHELQNYSPRILYQLSGLRLWAHRRWNISSVAVFVQHTRSTASEACETQLMQNNKGGAKQRDICFLLEHQVALWGPSGLNHASLWMSVWSSVSVCLMNGRLSSCASPITPPPPTSPPPEP